MVWIGFYFFLQTQIVSNSIKPLVYFAFLFSWLGDIFLMFQGVNPLFFIIVLASFLVSQIKYILVFNKAIDNSKSQKSIFKAMPYLILPFLFYGVFFYILLFPYLDMILKIAVLFYAIALVGMSATAFNRKKMTSKKSWLLVFIGAILFVISDSLIGVNKFLFSEPLTYDELLIMGTYIPAQYLIMMCLVSHIKIDSWSH
ncbi:MAG: lysoplasmalogenase [Flammeovirgaceae bacterium]|nr:lysoplasmalogenase [Flammeovirgaceae bacterium]